MTRRDALQLIGSGGVGAALLPHVGLARERLTARAQASFVPDVEIALSAAPSTAQILPGAPTEVWRFTGTVLRGPASAVQPIAGSYLGPTLRFRRGQKVRIRLRNGLAEPSIVHWHGLDSPSAMDGHPRSVIDPSAEFVYEFEVTNRAGTYWYHPHPHHRTGAQVYRGLAGLLIVSDDEDDALQLPAGEQEILMVLQDRRFDGANQLLYVDNQRMPMMDMMHGFLGDRVLVNGRPEPELSLGTRAYRLRILNGSSARIYKLAWSDGTAITRIGTDGGLLERPIERPYLTLAPGQRADVILDLSGRSVGSTLQLASRSYPAQDVDQAMGMMGGGPLPAGGHALLATVHVARRDRARFTLPSRLSTFGPSWREDRAAPVRRVPIGFSRGTWLLDDATFELVGVAAAETVKAGSTHVWEITNTSGMMGRPMAHPIHLHGRQFRVVSRQPATGAQGRATSLHAGIVDDGWTDTVLVMPGETVKIQVTFTMHRGLYLYHCHNLEHEDMGMMRNFLVD
jgi:FtsP/CotA-like multicopper oxidase with cupredoxin domain